MRIVFVHGWSVTNTDTYGELPAALSNAAGDYGLDLDIRHLYLGRYISFHDEVTLDDISRAMDRALRDLPGNGDDIAPFSCITHSTGGPVVRNWVDRFYGAGRLGNLPLKHLVMLAPANHGSTLAKLGKARVGRIKAWFNGVEPGQRVLDWLSLGSDGQWSLNERCLDYDYAANGFYPFVLVGQGIDHKLYDFINRYLIEDGSDGVVRVAGANMNYRYISLVQSTDPQDIIRKQPLTYALEPANGIREPKTVPLGVYNCYSHSGKKMGIMRSVKKNDREIPVVRDIFKCFQVQSPDDYQRREAELAAHTREQQSDKERYCMLVFNIKDDQGKEIGKDNYDLFLLAGKKYHPNDLPKGFFCDRQMNDKTGRLVYYLDANKMKQIKDGKFGIRIVARPNKGFSYYCAAEFQSKDLPVQNVLAPNKTIYIDVTLHRFVDKNVFRFDPAGNGSKNFKHIKPSGSSLTTG